MPTATTDRITVVTTHTGATWWISWLPTTGSSQCSSVPPMANAPPDATEPIANTIIGHVMTFGDSCGCASGAQRFSPKNVISITRVM